ncbi:MAG: hypothetical protein IID46_12655 [Planctomycetes bacterium]|nr:hypothetical protein [Planctomycetota bacterium]
MVASLAFLGFASAVLQGGPNYQSQLKDPLLKDYVFETTKVKKKTKDLKAGTKLYTVTTRRPQQDDEGNWAEEVIERNSPVLAQVIIAARNHLKGEQEEELRLIRRELDGYEENGRNVPGLQEKINRAIKEINEDTSAFQKREALLVAELQRIQKELSDVTDDAQNETVAAEKLQKEATSRREDVYRLKNQLEEIETDLYRAEQQRKKLEDLLIRVQSKVQRLKRRSKQLRYD